MAAALATAALPARSALAGRWLADLAGEVQSPAELVAFTLREVDGAAVDPGQGAVGVAGKAIGEGGLDRRRGGREASDRIVDTHASVVGGQGQALDLLGPEGPAQSQDAALLGSQVGIAAADARDVDAGAAHIVEDLGVRRCHQRIAQLLDAGSVLLAGHRDDEADRLDRRPVQTAADGGQGSEVGDLARGQVQIGRQVTDLGQDALAAAGQWKVEAGLDAGVAPRQLAVALDARPERGGVQL